MLLQESHEEPDSTAPATDPQAMLSVQGLWWRYPTFSDKPNAWTLRDISLRVEPGECFGITGPSGAGKTTLCRTLLGIIPSNARLNEQQLSQHFRGSISVMGAPVGTGTTNAHKLLQYPKTDRRKRENQIPLPVPPDAGNSTRTMPNTSSDFALGMVSQDPENQFLRMSLLHELGLGLQIRGVPNAEILQRIYAALQWVGLEHLWHGAAYLHPSDLSGGQKQRVAIAAFLALRPEVLILDEPTSDLDPVGKREVIETIARLRRDYRMTVVLVEQDPDILSTFCDRIALLHKGRIDLIAPPASFYAQREALEQAGIAVGELARISWQTGYTYASRPPLTLEEAASAFTPALVQRTFVTPPVRVESVLEPVVHAEGVGYQYGDGTMALKGVDLTLFRGEMLALLGPNGSGKTTFAKILAGIYRASHGQVQVLGQNLAARKVRARLPRSVGYVFQNPDHQLFCRKVSDEMEYGLKNLGLPVARRREIVAATLEAVELTSYADEDPIFLSKGQRQRLAVAAVLAMGPDILVVDEPTTGQDYRSITSIMCLLRDLQRQGKTILVITHDMTLVAEYCQRVVAFRDGLLAFTGTPTELFGNQEILQRTGLRPPPAAALATHLRTNIPDLPSLLTVAHWQEALRTKPEA